MKQQNKRGGYYKCKDANREAHIDGEKMALRIYESASH